MSVPRVKENPRSGLATLLALYRVSRSHIQKYGTRAGVTRGRSSLAAAARRSGVSNMAAPQDVHVRICNQEIVKFDLEVKALIQVQILSPPRLSLAALAFSKIFVPAQLPRQAALRRHSVGSPGSLTFCAFLVHKVGSLASQLSPRPSPAP